MGAKPTFAWMNGEFIKLEDAKVHIMSPAFKMAMSAFETPRYYEGEQSRVYIFRLREHLDRLFRTCKIFHIKIPYTREKLIEAHIETIKKNEVRGTGYVSPDVYMRFEPEKVSKVSGSITQVTPVNVVIIVAPITDNYFFPGDLEKGINCMISNWRRLSPNSCPPSAKIRGNYISIFLARKEANDYGMHEAILLDHRGFVAEASCANIFCVPSEKDITVCTPPTYSSILEGITRDTVITLAQELGYEVIETDITRAQLYAMEEVFLTASGEEVMPVREIDHRIIGDGRVGRVTKKMQQAYFNVVKGKSKSHLDWLTPVY